MNGHFVGEGHVWSITIIVMEQDKGIVTSRIKPPVFPFLPLM